MNYFVKDDGSDAGSETESESALLQESAKDELEINVVSKLFVFCCINFRPNCFRM